MNIAAYSTWVEIDLNAIQNNIRLISRVSGRPVMAVVKGNAYGHGMVEVARSALAAGATWCAVARIEEALQLREAGVNCPLLVLGYTAPVMAVDAARHNIRLTVYEMDITRQYARIVSAAGLTLKVHVKVDTGMSRLGLLPVQVADFITQISSERGLQIEGLFTHFARADQPQEPYTDFQIEQFSELVSRLEKEGIRPPVVHAANSAGSLRYPAAGFDLVRGGIAIYGLHPSDDAPLTNEFMPALSWKTRLVSIKTIPAGQGVSYCHRYRAKTAEKIGVIPVGYADGLRRVLGNKMLISEQFVPVLGSVCMDQCMISLENIPEAKLGDEVVIIGTQGHAARTAEQLGAEWGTINYEVTCGIAHRVPRVFIGL